MEVIFLSLGSNLGDRLEYLGKARDQIAENIGKVIQCSSVYETSPWGYSDSNVYLNQVIQVNTNINPFETLEKIGAIEQSMGRIRSKEGYMARIIDIDILLFGNWYFSSHSLKIPHPQLQNRRFVLVPLAEIAGEVLHHVLGKTIRTLLAECEDKGDVSIYP